MRAQLVEPAIDDDRDWSIVEKTFAFTHFNVYAVRAGRGARRVFIGDQMKAIVFFSAIRLADPNVSGSDEKGARAVAFKSGRRYLRALQGFGAQALDRISPYCIKRSDHHRVTLSSGVFRLPGPKARAVELRPLDLGKIFERAVALYCANFLVLVAIAAASVVPVSLVQYLVLLRERPVIDATLNVLQHPGHVQTEHATTLFNSPTILAVVLASAVFGYYMLAFAVGAFAAGVGRLYSGGTIRFADAYDAVLRRWPAVVAIVGFAILALVAAYTCAVLLLAIPIVGAAALATQWFSAVVAFAATTMVFAIAFALLCILAIGACALCTAVVESTPATWAIRLTAARILNRGEFGRAMLCAFGVAAIGLLASTVVDAAAFIGLARWQGAYATLDAAQRILVVPFLSLVLVVYYFDVRLRYEGFDLDAGRALAPAQDEPLYAPTAYLSGEERAVIKRFLERRDALTPSRRREIAARLATPVRTRVPSELQTLDDEPLLERL